MSGATSTCIDLFESQLGTVSSVHCSSFSVQLADRSLSSTSIQVMGTSHSTSSSVLLLPHGDLIILQRLMDWS